MSDRTVEEKQRVNEFLEELIQLQVKYKLELSSSDVSVWTEEDTSRAHLKNPNVHGPALDVNEANIREGWERYKQAVE